MEKFDYGKNIEEEVVFSTAMAEDAKQLGFPVSQQQIAEHLVVSEKGFFMKEGSPPWIHNLFRETIMSRAIKAGLLNK